MLRMCWRRYARRGWREFRRRRFGLRLPGSKAWSIGWSLCGSLHGVEFYNDSKATNVDAAMKAVASFAGGIHLILGGKDKNSDYGTMAELLKERVKVVYTIGSAAEKIERQLHGVVKIVSAETMQTAVAEAAKAAVAGDVVLLAPACSSFDQFENYEHRGQIFRQLVNELEVSRKRMEWRRE